MRMFKVCFILLYGHITSEKMYLERVAPLAGATHINSFQAIWHIRPDVGDVTLKGKEEEKTVNISFVSTLRGCILIVNFT